MNKTGARVGDDDVHKVVLSTSIERCEGGGWDGWDGEEEI